MGLAMVLIVVGQFDDGRNFVRARIAAVVAVVLVCVATLWFRPRGGPPPAP